MRKEGGMERMKKRYMMWVLDVDKRTPGDIIREELQLEKKGCCKININK